MTTKEFWFGAVFGIAALWAYHRFVSPVPGKGQ